MIPRRNSLWTLAVAGWLWGTPLGAQVARLPPVEPSPEVPRAEPIPVYPDTGVGRALEDGYPGRLLSYPDSTAELPQRPFAMPAAEAEPDADRPPDARDGVFQKLITSGTWLAPGGRQGFGIYELEGKVVLAFPFPLRKSHLVVTPGFGVHYLDGPRGHDRDLPPQLFDAWTQFRLMWPMTRRIGVDVAVSPGVFTDFDQGSDEALRFPSHAAVMLKWTPTVNILAGVAYSAREDASVLPIGGIIWTPNDDWIFEVVAPRPKIARRLYWGGRLAPDVQEWLYVAGEWGGGSWAVRRTDGTNDVVTLSDLRVILGWERKAIKGLDGRLELGYVFAREIDYKSSTPGIEPEDTVMLRGGLVY